MSPMRSQPPQSVLVLCVVALLLAGISRRHTASATYTGACDQSCCCKVCSATSMDAFPYGLPIVPNSQNVAYPSVAGATCRVPVWSAYAYNDTNGNPLTVPNTLFWTNPSLFGDSDEHVAPTTCSCCQLSVDTSCSEAAPLATRPKTILLPGGRLLTGVSGTITLSDGVELTSTDRVQLRRDTFCGYNGSTMEILSPQLLPSTDQTEVDITVTMPAAACYSVCYYHSTLTTPTWYLIGSVTVNANPSATISYTSDSDDVLLGGNTVTFTYSGVDLLSPFTDLAEIRASGTCGTAGYAARSGVNGADILQVLDGAVWCSPAVVAKITTVRPLRYIAVQYSDCAVANRIFLSKLKWTVTLPSPTVDTSYTMCYRTRDNVWRTAPTLLTVLGRRTSLTALQALYTSTNGAGWLHKSGWTGTVVCSFHGVRCDAAGRVTSIHLSRNKLAGPLPAAFFLSDLAGTLTFLSLDMNNITGAIPWQLGALKAVEFIDFGFNQLTGTLPVHMLGMTKIDVVYVSNNNLQGTVPDSIDNLSLQWLRNNLTSPVDVEVVPVCPTDVTECVDQGSTADGVYDCGYDGITELECTVMGCCFNAQAPLVFGGTSCFTKRSTTFVTYPQCAALSCVKQQDVVQ